jgi:murein DD-endopeptidase MepM/ murein hydrolase activator NlpD
MKKNKVFSLFLSICLVSCTTFIREQYASPIQLVGNSGEYIILPTKTGTGYLIKNREGNKEVLGLPYVTEEELIIIAGQEILMQPVDYGESRITITNNSLVNLSPEDQARANAEALKVNQAVKQVTQQTDFNFDFFPPVQNYITSGYGKKRFINGNPRSPHLALDIDGNEGDPIYAPKAGVVVIAEEHFYSGKMMLINHGGGLFTSYSHMSDWVAKEGDYVEAKELVGKVGSSGRVTGPHLHWVVYLNGNRINPELLVDLQYYQD